MYICMYIQGDASISIRKEHSHCFAEKYFESPESLPDRSAPQTSEPLRQVSLPDRLPDRSSQPYRPRRQPHDAPRRAKTTPKTLNTAPNRSNIAHVTSASARY